MLKRIHVNRHNIAANAKDGGSRPTISIRTYKGTTACHRLKIHGPSEIVYRPDKPLSCGARLWIETRAEVETQ